VKNLIFLGGKQIGVVCLEHLIELQSQGKLCIQGVLGNTRVQNATEKNVETIAVENNIPVISSLHNLPQTDILYSIQYHEILNKEHLQKAKLALNLHMAPLPEYRGCNQFSFAILDNAKVFGTTIHKIDTKIDHGDIAFEKRFSIPPNCWVDHLYKLTYEASIELFKESIDNILNDKIIFTPQENLVAKRGTQLHFRKEINDIKIIDKNWSEDKINRHVRATLMPGFEAPYYLSNNEKIYFTKESISAD
jgi:methionyl-tRNA formyltransferase